MSSQLYVCIGIEIYCILCKTAEMTSPELFSWIPLYINKFCTQILIRFSLQMFFDDTGILLFVIYLISYH